MVLCCNISCLCFRACVFWNSKFPLLMNVKHQTTVENEAIGQERQTPFTVKRLHSVINAFTLGRRNAMMSSLHRASSESESMPFWLITTNFFPFSSVHTFRKMVFTCAYGIFVRLLKTWKYFWSNVAHSNDQSLAITLLSVKVRSAVTIFALPLLCSIVD